MKPEVQQMSGGRGLRSLSYSGCTGWDRKERDEPCLCLFPPPTTGAGLCRSQRGAWRQWASLQLLIPQPPSLMLVTEAASGMTSAWTPLPLRAASLP